MKALLLAVYFSVQIKNNHCPFPVFPQLCLHNCTCHCLPWDRANILDCQNKGLTSLPVTVLKDTDWLLLSGNNFRSLNKAPGYLINITLLDLSLSDITEIDETLMGAMLRSVKHLDIRGNNLKEIPQIITKANNMTKLWLSNNPYECNCDMLWMKDWLTNTDNVMDKDNVTCSGKAVKGETSIGFPLFNISRIRSS